MGISKDSSGHIIVPIVKGHLAIPTTKRKYKIIDTISIKITKKDFIHFDELTKRLESDKHIIFIIQETHLTNELPDILYNKIKNQFPDYFELADFFVINYIANFDDFIDIHLDCLEELKHFEIKR